MDRNNLYVKLNQKNGIEGEEEDNGIITLLVSAFLILSFLPTYLPNFSQKFGWYGGLVCIIFASLLTVKQYDFMLYTYEIVCYLLILFVFFLSIEYNNNVNISSVFQYLRYILAAIVLGRTQLNRKIVRNCYYLFCIYFLFNMVLRVDPTTLCYGGVSRNIISIHLICILIIYIIILYREKKMYNAILPSLICLLICIWTGCRSGILSTIFIIYGVLLYGINIDKKRKIILFIFIVILGLGGVYFMVANKSKLAYLLYHLSGKENIKNNPRWVYLTEYFCNIKNSILDMMFGGRLKMVSSAGFGTNNFNLHNSFVMGHAKMGIGFIIFICFEIVRKSVLYSKKNKVFLFLLLAIIIRSFSDGVAFNGLYDILYYLFLIEIPLMQYKKTY